MTFQCQQCGRCCKVLNLEYHIDGEYEDVRRWKAEGRADILRWVDTIEIGDDPALWVYDFGINPRTHDEVTGSCPFLWKERLQDRYRCRIHATKPADCRAFPRDPEDGARVSCPGVWSA